MFQSKYNYKLIIDLAKDVFKSKSCETLVLPHLLKYFNDKIATSKNQELESKVYEQSILSLLVEYLLDHKKTIEIDTNQLISKSEIESNKCFDNLIQKKNLSQIRRLLDDKTYSNLHSSLLSYFKMLSLNTDSQFCVNQNQKMEFCVIAPLFIQDSTQFQQTILGLSLKTLESLNKDFETIKKIILQDTKDNKTLIRDYEIECLLFSLCVWSLMHFENKIESFVEPCLFLENMSLFESLIDLVFKLDGLKSEIMIINNQHCFELERHLIHLLRSLKYSLNLSTYLDQSIDKLRKQTERILSFLKNQLSSPYHEVNKFSSNFKN